MNNTGAGDENHKSLKTSDRTNDHGFPIAIVGIGCRMPGKVNSPESFWEVISEGRDTVTEIPQERWSKDFYDPDPSKPGKMATRRAGFVDGVDQFDHGFFKISPREAASMDPQQRLLLEVVEEAFEDAGIDPDTLKADCGVFVGISATDYMISNVESYHVNPYTLTGTLHSVAANRISHAFNLQGPSYAVNTACASSLTAMHLACTHIWSNECKVAVVSACNTILSPEVNIAFSVLGVLSQQGRCCPFSDDGDGYVRSEGWGALILKPLSMAIAHGDHIYSVIRGSAIATSGRGISLTKPSQAAQEFVMHEAYDRFNLSPSSVSYVEAHGTGTPVGDPIEANAIGNAFGVGRNEPLPIGSVKGNFGHSECAAGIASVIKASLMLSERILCPTINYTKPNTAIDFKKLKIAVQTEKAPFLPGRTYRIGVNSFGIGGAVAHVVLEEPPVTDRKASKTCGWTFGSSLEGNEILIPLSAKTKKAVDDLARKWLSFAHDGDALGVVAWQATRKMHHEYRMTIMAKSGDEFQESLNNYLNDVSVDSVMAGSVLGKQPKICFVFPGQGQQWASMGKNLYATEEVFRAVVNQCDNMFEKLSGWSLIKDAGLFRGIKPSPMTGKLPVVSEHLVDEMEICQPAILFLQLGLIHLLNHWGICPNVVVGHSFGEIAAAYACGGLTMEEAVTVIYHRSTQQAKLKGAGSMIALRQSTEETVELCNVSENLYIAAVNAPGSVTIGGNEKDINDLAVKYPQKARKLRVQCAFHTPFVDPIKKTFLKVMEGLVKSAQRQKSVPFYSTVDGMKYDGIFDSPYWWSNIRKPVLFHDAITNIHNEAKPDIFVELSASATLLSSVQQITLKSQQPKSTIAVGLGLRGKDDRHSALRTLGVLYNAGLSIKWNNVHDTTAKWAPLPTYPWQHQSHWSEPEFRMKRRLGMVDQGLKGQHGILSPDTRSTTGDGHLRDGDGQVRVKILGLSLDAKKDEDQLSRQDLEEAVRQKMAQMLYETPENIDITKPMIDYGVDSFMAVELVTWTSKQLHVEISQLDILSGISVSTLLEKALEKTTDLQIVKS